MAENSWGLYNKEFSNYLKLERSLSGNSIEAYLHDVTLLEQYVELAKLNLPPKSLSAKHLQGFLQHINELE